MDEDYGYEYDEGSDLDNWETEQVFQDREHDEGGECENCHEYGPVEEFPEHGGTATYCEPCAERLVPYMFSS